MENKIKFETLGEYGGDPIFIRWAEDPQREYDWPIRIGTEEDEDALINSKTGKPRDEKAEYYDAMIYCYVPDKVFREYDDEELQKYIDENFE